MRLALLAALLALALSGCGAPQAATAREVPGDEADRVTGIAVDLTLGDPDGDGATDLQLEVRALDDQGHAHGWTGGLDVQLVHCLDPACAGTETTGTDHLEATVESFEQSSDGWVLRHAYEPKDAPPGHYQLTVWAKMSKTGQWHSAFQELDKP